MNTIAQNNKRIAKNTLYLYIRMLLVMGVTLFTSRIVLKALGEDDIVNLIEKNDIELIKIFSDKLKNN